jgi:hypothetical protein
MTSHLASSRRSGGKGRSSRVSRARRVVVGLAILAAAVGVYVFVLSRGAIL